MTVGEPHHRQPAAGPAAGIGRRVGVDEVGRDGSLQPLGLGDRRHVAREPAIRRRIVVAQEAALGLGDPQQAGDGDRAVDLTFGAGFRGHSLGGDEAPVDQDGEAPRIHQRRDDPEARPQVRHRLHPRLAVMQEPAAGRDAAVLVRLARHGVEACRPRRRDGVGMDAGVDLTDQVLLPRQALDLPDAQRRKARDQHSEGRQSRDRSTA